MLKDKLSSVLYYVHKRQRAEPQTEFLGLDPNMKSLSLLLQRNERSLRGPRHLTRLQREFKGLSFSYILSGGHVACLRVSPQGEKHLYPCASCRGTLTGFDIRWQVRIPRHDAGDTSLDWLLSRAASTEAWNNITGDKAKRADAFVLIFQPVARMDSRLPFFSPHLLRPCNI